VSFGEIEEAAGPRTGPAYQVGVEADGVLGVEPDVDAF
jgi:hypothetical protein